MYLSAVHLLDGLLYQLERLRSSFDPEAGLYQHFSVLLQQPHETKSHFSFMRRYDAVRSIGSAAHGLSRIDDKVNVSKSGAAAPTERQHLQKREENVKPDGLCLLLKEVLEGHYSRERSLLKENCYVQMLVKLLER